jgi:enamine deaminase RidA (YjgF/YER057c/UK114 family)
MITKQNPPQCPSPLGKYVNAVLLPSNSRTLHISGQIGTYIPSSQNAPIDEIIVRLGETSGKEQAILAFQNIRVCMEYAGMVFPRDLVKVTVFMVRSKCTLKDYREAREEMMGDTVCASSLIYVESLALEEMAIEIEAIAADVAN